MSGPKFIGCPFIHTGRNAKRPLAIADGGGPPPPAEHTFTYVRKQGGSANGFDAGARTGWDYSGDVEITYRRTQTAAQYTVGFTIGSDPFGESYEMDFGALIADSGTVYYIVGASFTSTGVVVGAGDYVRIARTISDGAVKIYTGAEPDAMTLAYTFGATTTAALSCDMSFATVNTVNTIQVTEGGAPNAPTWINGGSGNLVLTTISMVPDSDTYTAGAPMTIAFTGGQMAADWIQIMAAGANEYSSGSTINWKYLDDDQSVPGAPVPSGNVVILAPSAGSYELVFLFNDLYIPLLQRVFITTT